MSLFRRQPRSAAMTDESRPGMDAVKRAMERADIEAQRTALYLRQHELDMERAHDERRQFVTTHCAPATAREYAAWLAGWLRNGGEISHVYGRPLTHRGVQVVGDGNLAAGPLESAPADLDWMVLRDRPGHVPSLYGANSLHVIVPASVSFTPDDVPRTFHGRCGHSTFYFMRGFTIVGDWVPLYTDVQQILEETL